MAAPPPFQAALERAPGPSPWYLRAPGAGLDAARGRLTWREAGRDDALVGKMILTAPDGAPLLVVDFYTRVVPLGSARFATWRQRKASASRPADFAPFVELDVHDADALTPLASVDDACRALSASDDGWAANAPALERLVVPIALDAGVHALAMPEALFACEEIFLVGDASAPGPGRPNVRVVILRPRAQAFEVVPQDWFNEGELDFGYQWITRVTRDPATGALVGDGIRIDPFRLDASGRRIAWSGPASPAAGPAARGERVRGFVAGSLLVVTAIAGFATVADDLRHVGEALAVGAFALAGVVVLAASAFPAIERAFPWRALGYGIALGGAVGLAINRTEIALPIGALVGVVLGFMRRRRAAR